MEALAQAVFMSYANAIQDNNQDLEENEISLICVLLLLQNFVSVNSYLAKFSFKTLLEQILIVKIWASVWEFRLPLSFHHPNCATRVSICFLKLSYALCILTG